MSQASSPESSLEASRATRSRNIDWRAVAERLFAVVGLATAATLMLSVVFSDSARATTVVRTVDLSGNNGSGKASANAKITTLSSRPGASKTLYLDLDGATITGTLWNTYYGQDSVTLDPFSLDTNPAVSAAEQTVVRDIWQRVAEDFAPFDINVTTVPPTAEQLDRADESDTVYGISAVLSGSTGPVAAKCGCGAGTINSDFGTIGASTPVIAWSALPYTSAITLADSISHEVGHALGLGHHGLATLGDVTHEYYDTAGVWAPLMGSADNTLTQWSDGTYRNASKPRQDDVAVLTEKIGATSDDYGNDAGTAKALPKTDGTTGYLGTIESRTDTDWFSFRGQGTTKITVSPLLSKGMNLDAGFSIVDAKGKVVPAQSASGFLATGTYKLKAGTYYVVVDGIGDSARRPAYTDYGSLGRYTVTVKTTPVPKASKGAPSQKPAAGNR